MTPSFRFLTTERFEQQAARLPEAVYKQLKVRLSFLEEDPRHPSLKTHQVKGVVGDFGGKIFEAYVTEKYRMTWEYGPSKGDITLRNVDNHDACLGKP